MAERNTDDFGGDELSVGENISRVVLKEVRQVLSSRDRLSLRNIVESNAIAATWLRVIAGSARRWPYIRARNLSLISAALVWDAFVKCSLLI